ncbi:penicillin-binding protein 2 [Neobacillus sp. PS3-34]|uniref:peptidoglycan D,D-transpeptidase FtsI family protein n=1 Tax=Neobacillus sp. PS3-34 TaxID=3070678 RepID=UPI0027E1EC71|nr:penicillin-binding protein 2 [Neobacillus sp. PS3-34]WML48641.1 penicillin-binding protein 2 [Neobacillus sp. PS3-34]
MDIDPSETGQKKVTMEEKKLVDAKKLSNKDLYQKQLKRITEEELNKLTPKDLQVAAIYRQMSAGYALNTQYIKNKDVTEKEYAFVSEHLDELPGVDVSTDWERGYKYGSTLRSVLGAVTTSDEGLPKEEEQKFVALGYNRNERVGKSYIEKQYEDVLQGQKEKVKNVTFNGSTIETETVREGTRGNDLVLTVDMDLQSEVDKIVTEELLKTKETHRDTPFLDRAYAMLMDPFTGDILAMSGKRLVVDKETNTRKIMDDALGTFTTSYTNGSVVKGATVLTGYQTGAISPGNKERDEPIILKDTPIKKSYRTFGWINDLEALKFSSNVYMFKTAMKIGGTHYVPNGYLNINPEAFNVMRKNFSQFGLGVKTGIDLPNESSGFHTNSKISGLLLDLAIGQFDTYTPLQLVQYVSTIANGGYRIKPHLAKEIRQPGEKYDELGPLLTEIQPQVLNRLDMKQEWIERVQEGFRQVMQVPGGTGYRVFGNKPYKPAGKTGTAQAFYDGPGHKKGEIPPPTWNITLVAYAPYDHPEVAMSVVVPWAYQSTDPGTSKAIGSRVLDAYFDLKKKRNSQR